MFVLTSALVLSSTLAFASDDVGYSAFIKYRNFGAKKGVSSSPQVVVSDPDGGKNIFPSINSFAMSYFGNLGRTVQDAIAMGDWDKEYRVVYGYEHNYTKSKNSTSSYGSTNNTGNFFANIDKSISPSIRVGGGLALGVMDADYSVEDMYQNQQSAMSYWFLSYKNTEYDILHRSIAYLGYGNADLKRISDTGTYTSDFSTLYYGMENIVYKNVKINDSKFYLRPTAEFNYYGTNQEGFNEGGKGFNLPDNNAYKVDIGLAFYAGYKAEKFDIRLGYDWTSILSDPRKAYDLYYYDGSTLELDKKTSDNNYGTWRASFSCEINNNASFVSDIRYYDRDSDNIMFTLGLNYDF